MQDQSTSNGHGAASRSTMAALAAAPRPRVAVVGRVSTLDQERYGTSLEDQVHKGALLAQLHDMEVIPSEPYQGDESGALPLEGRPIMQRLIADGRAGVFDAVCFHKIDRIARRLKYILDIWDQLTEAGVTVYIIEPAIDTSTLMGRLLRNVLGTIAEFERDLLMERTAGGREREMAAGAVYAPRGKYGYQYVRRDRAGGVVPHLRPHPQWAEVVRRIYRLRARSWSYARIASLLTAEGVPTPSEAMGYRHTTARWGESTVQKICCDRAYMGEASGGVYTYLLDKRGRRRQVRRAGGQGTRDIAYPPVVAREEFFAAQAAGSGAGSCVVRTGADRYLLYGAMVRCTEHGRAMTGSQGKRARRKYRCHYELPAGGRSSHHVDAQDLEEGVWGQIVGAMLDSSRMVDAATAIAREAESGMEEVARERAEIGARLERLAEQRGTFFTEMREAGASAEDMREQARQMSAEEGRLRARLEPLAAQIALHQAALPQAEQVRTLCEAFVARAFNADAATKRELLEALETEVLVSGHDYRIEGVLGGLGLSGALPAPVSTSSGLCGGLCGLPFVLSGELGRAAQQSAVGGQHARDEVARVGGRGEGEQVA